MNSSLGEQCQLMQVGMESYQEPQGARSCFFGEWSQGTLKEGKEWLRVGDE